MEVVPDKDVQTHQLKKDVRKTLEDIKRDSILTGVDETQVN